MLVFEQIKAGIFRNMTFQMFVLSKEVRCFGVVSFFPSWSKSMDPQVPITLIVNDAITIHLQIWCKTYQDKWAFCMSYFSDVLQFVVDKKSLCLWAQIDYFINQIRLWQFYFKNQKLTWFSTMRVTFFPFSMYLWTWILSGESWTWLELGTRTGIKSDHHLEQIHMLYS